MSEPASTTHPAAGYGTAFPEPVPPWGGPERSLPGIEAHPAGDGTLVAVSGALDLLTEQALYDALHEVLGRSVRGIDLDLSGIDFCDCAGLNALLRVRRQARDEDRTVAVRNASAVVHRLLSVTRTRPLFTVVDENHLSTRQLPDASSGPIPHRWKESVSLGEAHHDPRIELVQLRRAMQTRPVIDLARGALMASFGLSPSRPGRSSSRSPRTRTPNCTTWPKRSSAPSPDPALRSRPAATGRDGRRAAADSVGGTGGGSRRSLNLNRPFPPRR